MTSKNDAVEENGLRFETLVSEQVLHLPPPKLRTFTTFEVGVRITNTTSAPIRLNVFDTLTPQLLRDGVVVDGWYYTTVYCVPTEASFPHIQPGKSLLLMQSARLGWGTYPTESDKWWIRVLIRFYPGLLLNLYPQLFYTLLFYCKKDDLFGLKMTSSFAGGDARHHTFPPLSPGSYQIRFEYSNRDPENAILFGYDDTIMERVDGLWVGTVQSPLVTINLVSRN